MSEDREIRSVLATDCGSTTTKAILIEKVDGEYRQTWRGEAPTTVEAPFEDVTRGVVNAATEIQELSGRKLIHDDGTILTPETSPTEGVDLYISTSSAGGGLQLVVGGVVRGEFGHFVLFLVVYEVLSASLRTAAALAVVGLFMRV